MVRIFTFIYSGVTSWKINLFVIKRRTSHMMNRKPKVKNAASRPSPHWMHVAFRPLSSWKTIELSNVSQGFSVNPTFQRHFLKPCSALETLPWLLVCCPWCIRTDAMALTGNETQKEVSLVQSWRGWMTVTEEENGPTGELEYRWRELKGDKSMQESSRVEEDR